MRNIWSVVKNSQDCVHGPRERGLEKITITSIGQFRIATRSGRYQRPRYSGVWGKEMGKLTATICEITVAIISNCRRILRLLSN